MRSSISILCLCATLSACSQEAPTRDASPGDSAADANTEDRSAIADAGGATDSGATDSGAIDSGTSVADTGVAADSGASADSGAAMDSGGAADSGASADSGAMDASTDSGVRDSGTSADSGVSPCISGARGTHVARIRWTGSAPMSRASVSYEANTLPDRTRWRAGAYSRGAIGSYTPTFTDTFLGEGGLELGSTNFIDIELSTAGLGAISNVTVALYGRSFNTVSSGSYAWMSFDGAGATPSGSVFNSAPYQWYPANATTAFRAGNAGVLFRFWPQGPSSSLIVNRIELCFDAR